MRSKDQCNVHKCKATCSLPITVSSFELRVGSTCYVYFYLCILFMHSLAHAESELLTEY